MLPGVVATRRENKVKWSRTGLGVAQVESSFFPS
ncbi:hypothetical protein ACP70R_025328 [Stipagrostis hirtigluma subsp. patula]